MRTEYAKTLRLTAPIALSQVGQLVVQIVDSAMVGRLGAVPLAGVAFGGNVYFFLFFLGLGLTMGITPLVGELHAQGQHRKTASILQNSVGLYFLVGCFIVVGQLATVALFPYMNQPLSVLEAGTPYYKYLAWSSLPIMVFLALRQFLEGVGNTRIAMIVTVATNLLNILLNWVFIYGNWGAPAMGAAGAGLATLISRALMPVMMMCWFVWNRAFRRYLLFYDFRAWSRTRVRSLLAIGFPISAQMMMEGGTFILTGIMMGWFGAAAIAANQIAILVCNMAYLIVLSIGNATTIRVSHAFGLRDWAGVRRICGSSLRLALCWNFLMALVFVGLRGVLPRVFAVDAAVLDIAAVLLLAVASFQLFDGAQGILLSVLRGMQDVRATSVIAFFSYIVLNLPVGCLFAFWLGWGPSGLWMGYLFGFGLAACLLWARYRRILRRFA